MRRRSTAPRLPSSGASTGRRSSHRDASSVGVLPTIRPGGPGPGGDYASQARGNLALTDESRDFERTHDKISVFVGNRLRRASLRRKIAPSKPGIRKCRLTCASTISISATKPCSGWAWCRGKRRKGRSCSFFREEDSHDTSWHGQIYLRGDPRFSQIAGGRRVRDGQPGGDRLAGPHLRVSAQGSPGGGF